MKRHSTFRQIMISYIITYQKDDCAAHLLIFVLCTCSIRMYLDMTDIDHQPLKVCVLNQYFFHIPLPCHRHNPPGRSCSQNPKYTVDKLLGISALPPCVSPFSSRVWLDFPDSITYLISTLFSYHFFAPFFLGVISITFC